MFRITIDYIHSIKIEYFVECLTWVLLEEPLISFDGEYLNPYNINLCISQT